METERDMYKVIVRFKDLQDGNRLYNVGDKFPRDGVTVSSARLQELSTNRNRRRTPLIEMVSKASPLAEKTSEASNPIETSSKRSKPKRRARRGKEENG